MFKGLIFYVCAQFGADENKNVDLLKLNVVSHGDCWALIGGVDSTEDSSSGGIII